jgi:flagellar M-ring protein FliF
MDFINRSYEQLSELFRSMTPGGRITAALLLVVVVVSVAYLFNVKADGPDFLLLGGQSFTTEETNAMQAAFGKADLSDFEINGGQISIPKSQQAAYLAALADGDALPLNFGDYLTKALEKSSIMGSSSDRQRAFGVAQLQHYSAIIRALPYVKTAAVAYEKKRRSTFSRQPKTNATATVTPQGTRQLTGENVVAIRSIVAGGFGLQPGDVIVVDTNGRTHAATKEGGIAAGADSPYFMAKATHEQNFTDKIYAALDYIPGVRVAVNVELDRTTKSISDQLVIKGDEAIVLTSRTDKRSNTTTQNKGGRVGLAAQSGANKSASLGGGGGGGPESVQKDELKEDSKTAPYEKIHTETAALTPTTVKVAVTVPTSYLEQVFREQQEPPAEGEELAKPTEQQLLDIEGKVAKNVTDQIPFTIPIPQGLTGDDVVKVAFVQTVTLPEVEGPPITETATSWVAMNWGTLGMFGFAGFGLIMLRSMLNSTPAVAALASGAQMASGTATNDDEAEAESHERQLQRRIPSGPNLAEELAEIVKEDSEAAANVLRGWITSGT